MVIITFWKVNSQLQPESLYCLNKTELYSFCVRFKVPGKVFITFILDNEQEVWKLFLEKWSMF